MIGVVLALEDMSTTGNSFYCFTYILYGVPHTVFRQRKQVDKNFFVCMIAQPSINKDTKNRKKQCEACRYLLGTLTQTICPYRRKFNAKMCMPNRYDIICLLKNTFFVHENTIFVHKDTNFAA